MTAPTATADEHALANGAAFLRYYEKGRPELLRFADRLEALAVRYDLMLEVIAAADAFAFAPEGAAANGDRHRALMAAVRALREAT